jgi:hypothetical protein
MGFTTKYQIATLLIVSAASSALFAQTTVTERVPNARTIVSQSIAATDRSWQARSRYTFIERDEDRRLDMQGKVKSENIDVTKMMLINGARFEQLIQRNGQPPSAEEQKRLDQDRESLGHESQGDRAGRIGKEQENRAFLGDILDAFDFQLIAEETLHGRPAYVIQVTPHSGYRAHGKYGKMFSKVEGRLWIDKQDFGWIKVEGRVTQSFSMGLFVARVQEGSRIILEQTNVGDRVWVPERLEMRASAKILFLKNLAIERILTYSDYLSPADAPYSVGSLR